MPEDESAKNPSPANEQAAGCLIAIFENMPRIVLVLLILGVIAFRIFHGPVGTDDDQTVWLRF